MTQLVHWFFRALRFIIVACLVVMVVLVFGNVVLRYAFNSGITVSEELSRWLFVWLTFLGAIVAMRDRAHLGMDSVVSRLPAWGKKACFLVSNVLMLYVTYLFFVGSWQQTLINMDNRAPATGLSSGLYYGVGLVFCVCVGMIIVYHVYELLSGKLGDEQLIQIRESEDEARVAMAESHEPEAPAGTVAAAPIKR